MSSHPVRVRGLKLKPYRFSHIISPSHPVRVRGLKRVCKIKTPAGQAVAPRAGAWVETRARPRKTASSASHPVRVRGLKPSGIAYTTTKSTSHPVRVRGLKRTPCGSGKRGKTSHPVRVRGLKRQYRAPLPGYLGRTPCGCVG